MTPTGPPRLTLATLPTRVQRLDNTSRETGREVWVKRDDESSATYGGNKVRKLEFLLADAKAHDKHDVCTMGAFGSHHAFATAWYAHREGLIPHCLLFPQPMSPKDVETLRATASLAEVRRLPPPARTVFADAAAAIRMRLSSDTYWIPGGGSSPTGTLGFVEAAFELADQIRRGDGPMPKAVIVALGSAGTAAGLALGFALRDLAVTVVGVRVVPLPVSSRPTVLALIARTLRAFRGARFSLRDLRFVARAAKLLRLDNSQLGDGYAHTTSAAHEALATAHADGLRLETTYTGKAFAALISPAPHANPMPEPILFWQSFAGCLPEVSPIRPIPEWVTRISG